MTDLALIEPKETAKAAQAFADYVNLGPTRSLRKLHVLYCQQGANGAPTKRFETLAEWSTENNWQDRLKQIAAHQLESASELKTTTYINILGEYHRRVSDEPRRQVMELNALHGIYDRVKPETPQTSGGSGPSITVNFAFVEVTRPE